MSKLDVQAPGWAQVSRLLDEVLELPPAERESWLERLAPEFHHLKPQLQDLLSRAASVETGEFLKTLPKFDVDPDLLADERQPHLQVGHRVGPYRLLRKLGHGGMGSVWLAERADGLINRPVAVKLPHRQFDESGLAERMAREREILATLDHRNIARLLDAGVAADGQPYLALEFVEGLPIDQYCSAREGESTVSLARRLQLFLQVARAVAYAHGKLVVHRDLKPANILVTAAGGVRLLDFGIAKLLSEGQTRETRLTQLSGQALTPDYASPEQILGEPLTVSSDVYSLGVILYELLTGARPYRLERASRRALEDTIMQTQPVPPSEAAPPEARRALRGDLDTVVLKALKKDPAERYTTASALAEDIERYLQNRPVLAQPDSEWYRLRKFIARNKGSVGAVAAVFLAIVIGACIAVWQMFEADAQRRAAELHQQRAESVKAVLLEVFREADPDYSGGQQLSAADLLARASRRFENASIEDPLVRVEVLRVIASSLLGVQDLDGAERVIEVARDTAARHLAADHVETVRVRLLRAELLRHRGLIKDWRAELDAVQPMIESARFRMPAEHLNVLMARAHLEIDDHEYGLALDWAAKALNATREAYAESSFDRAEALQIMSLAHAYAGYTRPEHREPAEQFALQAMQASLAAADGNSRHPLVINARANLARAYTGNQRVPESIREWEGAIADGIVVWGENALALGSFLENLSEAYRIAGRVNEAVDTATRALAIAHHETQTERNFVVFTRKQTLGAALFQARQPRAALAEFDSMVKQPVPAGIPARRMLTIRAYRALCLAELGETRRAVELSTQIVREQAQSTERRYLPLYAAARVARLAGDARTAARYLEEAHDPTVSYSYPVYQADVLLEAGHVHLALNDLDAARHAFEEAESIYDSAEASMKPLRADGRMGLSRVFALQGLQERALTLAREADEFWRQFAPQSVDAGRAARWMAELQRDSSTS